jgi:formylglycine-generating enzyme required for sulfatase activity
MAKLNKNKKWLILILATALFLMGIGAAAAQDSSPPDGSEDTVEMISIRDTTFEMGSEAEAMLAECNQFRTGCELSWFTASEPVHTVQLDPFSIDLYEVTNEAFLEFVNELESIEAACDGEDCIVLQDSQIRLNGDERYTVDEELLDHPVAGATWYGANAFCEWRDARLPTEAEWELAAGLDFETGEKRQYPWGNEFDGNITNFCDVNCQEQQANNDFDDGYTNTAPVGSYEEGRSSAGLYDVAGNLWEWINDWYDPDYYANSPEAIPRGPLAGDNKVVRGGSWFDTGNFTSTSVRFPAPPDESGDSIGFRCASDIVDEEAMIGIGDSPEETAQMPTAAPTVRVAATEKPTVEPTVTATVEPTVTATVEPMVTATVEPKATQEPTTTPTKIPTATDEPEATATEKPTSTATVEPTPTSEPRATATVQAPATTSTAKQVDSQTDAPFYLNCKKYPGIDRGDTYVVGACDFLVKVAIDLGVPYRTLLAANPQIKNPDYIFAGQVINVPSREGQPAPVIPAVTPLPPTPTPATAPSVEIVVPQPPSSPPATPSGSTLRG